MQWKYVHRALQPRLKYQETKFILYRTAGVGFRWLKFTGAELDTQTSSEIPPFSVTSRASHDKSIPWFKSSIPTAERKTPMCPRIWRGWTHPALYERRQCYVPENRWVLVGYHYGTLTGPAFIRLYVVHDVNISHWNISTLPVFLSAPGAGALERFEEHRQAAVPSWDFTPTYNHVQTRYRCWKLLDRGSSRNIGNTYPSLT
jgi:hypothetical protein